MRSATAVVFLGIDAFLTERGKPLYRIEEFLAELDERGIPCVWLSERSRAQLDEPRRRLGHNAPFIAESGSGAYLPEDYFHLKARETMRLGRFLCIPVAEPQPAAQEALTEISEETGISVVPLRTLTPRELAQNTGLPLREAELCRMRDFSELFFFAGAGEEEIKRFLSEAASRNVAMRQHGALWSLAAGASEKTAVREVSGLYDRALRSHAIRVGVTTGTSTRSLAEAYDRLVELQTNLSEGELEGETGKRRRLLLTSPDLWEQVLATVGQNRSH